VDVVGAGESGRANGVAHADESPRPNVVIAAIESPDADGGVDAVETGRVDAVGSPHAPAVESWRTRASICAALCVAAALLGFVHAALFAHLRLADELRFEDEGRDVRIVGTVASLPASLQRGVRFEFAVESLATGGSAADQRTDAASGVHVPARVALSWYGDDVRVRPAQRWEFTVRLRRPHGNFNPGGFDIEAWMLERGVRASGVVRVDARSGALPRKLDELVAHPLLLVDRARDGLRDALRRHLQEPADGKGEGAGPFRYAGVLIALVLGDQRAIRESDWLLFNRTGIAHLVSISGLHITMIAGLAAVAVGALWRRSPKLLSLAAAQSAAAIGAVIAALLYCLLAGWGVPAQRTFLMLLTVAAALWLRIGTRPMVTLTIAAFVVCVIDPWAVLAPGFWLSFGAVAAIFAAMHGRTAIEQAAKTIWRRLREAAHVQIAVTIALVPLTIALFQQVSLISPLANAIAIPVVSLVVTPLALLAAAFVALPEPLGAIAVPLLAIAHWLFALLAQGLELAAALPAATVTLAAPPAWTVVLACAGVAWLLMPKGWPQRWLGALWLLPALAWPVVRPPSGEAWITALDVGQGMAVLVETPTHALLYDTGPRFSTAADAGGRVIAPYLRARGIDRLDWLVVSHLDSDHSGGAASLLQSVPIASVLTSIEPAHPAVAGPAQVHRCVDGQAYALGALQVRVLHPESADYARPQRETNARSCVLELRWGAHRVLLTGDLPAAEEARLTARYPELAQPPSTLISVPHHGSRHSSSAAFVAGTQPRWALVQAGYRNRFGHPDAGVIARYQSAGAEVARTDHLGALSWRLHEGGGVQVSAARVSAARYWHNRPAVVSALPPATAAETADPDGREAPRLPAGPSAEIITPDQP
jgi:competence protein ComEC